MHEKVVRFVDVYRRSSFGGALTSVLTDNSIELHKMIGGRLDFHCLPSSLFFDDPPNADGTSSWKLIDSPITENMTHRFEGFIGHRLPRIFKDYLQYKCIPNGYLYEAVIPSIDPEAPLSWLEWQCTVPSLFSLPHSDRYYPICSLPADSGVLCVDSASPSGSDDFRLVARGYPGVSPPASVASSDFPTAFESFEAYIDFIIDWLTFSINRPRDSFLRWMASVNKPIPHAYYATVNGE